MRRELARLLCVAALSIPMAMAEPRPAVVELFTSQGCSSCPPADALLGELAERSDVLALAFHVDYWDDLGWRDRFASPLFTQRQQRYEQALHLPSAFTPQALIDGQHSVVGSNRNALLAAVRQPRSGIPLKAHVSGDTLLVDLEARSNRVVYDVLLIAYLPQAVTPVPRGENRGHRLTEFNIVRSYRTLGSWDGAAHRFQTALSSLPGDATKLAILLQIHGQGEIVGAISMTLPQH